MWDDIVNGLAKFFREHSVTLCLAWCASIMVIYGNQMVRFTKNLVKSWHFMLRLLFFVLVCGFGYGIVTVYSAKLIHRLLIELPNLQLNIAVIISFLLLGFLAEKNRVI
ncbi:DUF3392 domain-containing protein [Akkermansiaceae bacterium]|nr:DUF3392 domain-containing protein [Akkermansiaceae bacterium]